jgi:hypothetical protein
VILEALNPGRMQAHASTAEVPRGAARARGGRAATTAPTCRAEFAGPAADSGRLPDAPPARTRICARTARRASTAPVWPAPAFAPVTSAAPARSTATVAAAAPNGPAPSVSACVRCRPTGRPDRPMPPATPASVTSPRPVPGARRSARSSASTLPGRGVCGPCSGVSIDYRRSARAGAGRLARPEHHPPASGRPGTPKATGNLPRRPPRDG